MFGTWNDVWKCYIFKRSETFSDSIKKVGPHPQKNQKNPELFWSLKKSNMKVIKTETFNVGLTSK